MVQGGLEERKARMLGFICLVGYGNIEYEGFYRLTPVLTD